MTTATAGAFHDGASRAAAPNDLPRLLPPVQEGKRPQHLDAHIATARPACPTATTWEPRTTPARWSGPLRKQASPAAAAPRSPSHRQAEVRPRGGRQAQAKPDRDRERRRVRARQRQGRDPALAGAAPGPRRPAARRRGGRRGHRDPGHARRPRARRGRPPAPGTAGAAGGAARPGPRPARHRAGPVPLRPGDRHGQPPGRRSRDPDLHAAADHRARPERQPHPGPERGDAGPPGADRPPRPALVPRGRHRRASPARCSPPSAGPTAGRGSPRSRWACRCGTSSAARPTGPESAVLLGGYHGTWLPAAQAAALTLDNRIARARPAPGSAPAS